MRNFTFLLFALLFSLVGYSQFPTPGTEGFENTNGPDVTLTTSVVNPSPWTLDTGNTVTGNQWAVFDNGINVGSNPTRRWDRATTNFYAGTQAAFINRRQNGAAGVIVEDYLATPLVTVPANGQLTFWTRTGFNITDQQVIDNLSYLIKVNTNISAGSQTTYANYTNTVQTWDNTTIAAVYNEYEMKTVNLAAYAGQQVYIAFVRRFNQPTGSLSGNSWYVDDVKLVQRCLEPTNQTGSNYTTTTASLSWTPNGSTSWEIEVVPVTGTPTGTGVIYNGALPYVATGLTPATGYVYYVRAKCSDSDSNWVGPYNFTTATPGFTCASPITIPSLPYSTTDNTANYGDTYDVTQPTACAGTATNYMTGNDVFYSYTPTTSGNISITMTPGGTWSGIFVYQGCANVGLTCVAGVANSGNTVRNIPSLSVTAGLPYIIVISTNATPQTVPYSLLIQQVNCPQPTALAANAITANGATLSWTNATSTSWEYVVQAAGSVIPSGSGTTASTSTGTAITGLNSDTAYQYWVRADCGNTTFSAWSGPFPFTTAVAPPVCGGTFVDPGGQAGNYPNGITAATGTYQICPNPGEQVTVTFTAFNTQLNNDLLKVYNGSGTTGTLLGTFSGPTLPPAVTSSSPDGCLTFVFTSNANTNAAGWVANVTCAPAPACQKPILLTAPTASITYNSVSVGWTQNANPDTTTPSQWEVIALPCTSPAPTATSTGTLTTSNPFVYNIGLSPLTCYNFYVRAVCSASSSSEWSGPVSATTTVAPAICGGNFVDPGGISANYPNNVTATTGGTTTITTTPGNQVTVTFTLLNTQLNTDLLKVYDGLDATGTLLATYSGVYTGAALPQITSSSPSGALTFVFTSNGGTNAAGWFANVTCALAPACQKPILLTAPTASVTYNSVSVGWTQNANPDTTTPSQWEVIAVPCTSPAPTAASTGITTTSNPFVYPGLSPLTCYNFYVRAVCSTLSSSEWTGPVSATTTVAPAICGGNFVDPGGPTGNYTNNITAATGTTTICPNAGEQVTVTFTSFNTELNNDLLKVYNGTGTSGTLLATYSGTTLPPAVTSSSPDGCLTFVFTSNAGTVAAGWIANVTCAPAPPCQQPILLTTSAIQSTSVSLGWTQNANPDTTTPSQWEVIALPCGSPAPTATSVGTPTSGNPFTVTGLTPSTCYDLYVRAMCTSPSSWTGPKPITTTLCDNACNYTFTVSDSFGDSWNGNTMSVIQNGLTVATLTGPTNAQGTTPQNVLVTLCPGPFQLVWNAGGTFPNEVGVSITSFLGDVLYTHAPGTGLQNTTLYTDVTICTPPTCVKPSGLLVTNINTTSALLSWTGPANASSWQVVVQPVGTGYPVTPAVIYNTNNLFYAVIGLTPGTNYEFYVRAVCSDTDSSIWAGPKPFSTTLCDNGCNYIFTVSDSFGDGWNGNTMNVIQNGVTVATLTGPTDAQNQTPIDVIVSLCPGPFELFWNAGGTFGTEVGIKVTSFLDEVLYTHTPGTSLQNTLLYTDVTNCIAPTCSKPINVTASPISGNSITYTWTQPINPDTSYANSWKVLLLPCNDPIPTASTPGWIPWNSTTYVANGLTTSTCYSFYVMAVCSGTDSSPIKSLLGTTTTCGSQQASATCSNAPPVCLLQGYCGNTSSQYAPPHTWAALTTAFSNCLGGASIENNSFINFQATSTTALFNIYVYNSLNADGVQFFAFQADCDSPTVVSKGCALVAPTGLPGVGTPVSFQMTGLTPGGSYHLMFDGYAGDVCDYQVIPVNGVFTAVDVTPTAPTICIGQSVVLTASGGNNTYTWTPSVGLSTTTGTTVTANPTATTTYTVTSSSSGTSTPGCDVTKSVTVTVNPLAPPVIDFSYTTPVCVGVSTASPIPGPGFTSGGTYSSTSGLVINSTSGQIDLFASLPGTYTVTYTIGSDVALCRASNTSISTITINPGITPVFITPAPICSGATAPILPLISNNTTPITGTWNPPTVSNTASGTYTFTPTSGQCVTTTTLNVTINTNCSFGSYASAVWLTNCGTSSFFNTVGSGADIIGPIANVFPNANLGTYVQGSNALILRGAEVKTFKNPASNVCSARLNYRVFSGTPSGIFEVMDLPFFDNCGSGSFPISGGPCNTGDQKWQRVVADGTTTPYPPVDLTAYPPGNYTIQVYYDISGSASSTSGCTENILIDNNGAYYSATFTIQAQPAYASANPTTCGGSNGSITISGMAPNTTYSLTYNDDATVVGPINVLSNTSGEILISGLNSGTYSNFLISINSCLLTNTTPIVLVDPIIPTVTVNSETICDSSSATITATPGASGIYSYVWTVPGGAINPGNFDHLTATIAGTYSVVITNTVTGCSSASASGILTVNPTIIPTFASVAPICKGTAVPLLSPTSNNIPTAITGSWLPSAIDNTVSASYVFTPDPGQCSQQYTINVTVNSVPTPTATLVTPATCVLPTATVDITPHNSLGAVVPTDLFISEVTDSNFGSLSYVEIYNGTGLSVNLSNYSIKTATNGSTTYLFTLPLNSFNLPSGSTYVVAIGNDALCSSSGGDGSLAAQSTTITNGSVNFESNGNDHFALFNGTTKIDSWGTFGSNNWAPSGIGTEGADFRRKITATVPSVTFNNNDWDVTDYVGTGLANCVNNDYSGIGTYSYPVATSYQYNVDNGAYQSSSTFSGLSSGTHTFTIQDTNTGCISDPVSFNVSLPVLNLTVTVTSPTVCQGINLANVIVSPSQTGNYTYTWTYPSGATNPGNVDHFTATVPGNYGVTITDNTIGCTTSVVTSVVTINPIPTVTVNNPTVCIGTSAVVTAIATSTPIGTYIYTWTYPVGASDPGNVDHFTATVPGNYGVTITDSVTGCTSLTATSIVTINALPTVVVNNPTVCQGLNAVVTATASSTPIGTYIYTWTYPVGASDPGNVDHFTATVSGNYGVTITDSVTGCTSLIATSIVTINALPTVTVNNPTVCIGTSAVVTATVTSTPIGTYSYTWTYPVGASDPGNVDHFTAIVPGNYGVTITDSVTGCTSLTATSIVTINTLPTVGVNNPTVCQGINAVVTALPTSIPTGLYSYSWTYPSGALNPGNVDHFTANVSGNYSLTITDSVTGCSSLIATSVVTINVLPVVVVTGDSVCQGSLATISTSTTPTGTYNYVWTVPSGANPGNVSTFTTAISGTYSVIATNPTTGCSSISQSGVATISPAFSFDIADACVNNNFTLEVVPNANSFDVNTANFTWQYAGNTVGTNSSTFDVTNYLNYTTAVETLPLTFSVIVQSNGCQQTDSIVLDRIYCEIQRGISPNNDGKNENFDLRQMNVQQLSIYNRYGTKVYSKVEYANEWVGQSDAGNELPDGTYYYVIEFKNNQASKTGWIYINRENK